MTREQLTNILFVNNLYQGLKDGLELIDQSTLGSRTKLISTLNYGIDYCFRSKKAETSFLSCEVIHSVLKHDEQLLFGKVGYISLLQSLCRKIVKNMEESVADEENDAEIRTDLNKNNEYNEIYRKGLMLLCAICKNNRLNLG